MFGPEVRHGRHAEGCKGAVAEARRCVAAHDTFVDHPVVVDASYTDRRCGLFGSSSERPDEDRGVPDDEHEPRNREQAQPYAPKSGEHGRGGGPSVLDTRLKLPPFERLESASAGTPAPTSRHAASKIEIHGAGTPKPSSSRPGSDARVAAPMARPPRRARSRHPGSSTPIAPGAATAGRSGRRRACGRSCRSAALGRAERVQEVSDPTVHAGALHRLADLAFVAVGSGVSMWR